jgi:uridine kinase
MIPPFSLAEPRGEIHLPDVKLSAQNGAQWEISQATKRGFARPIVGAVVNSDAILCPIYLDSRVRPITMNEEDGMLIYRRSLTFLLDTAFEELFPDDTLTIDHSVSSGGYYCEVSGGRELTLEELKNLEAYMQELIDADQPFTKREVPLKEAIAYFEAKGYTDKVRLLSHRTKDYLVLYRLVDHQDYHHGYMVPSTGYLQWFDLYQTNGGFTLHFPRRHRPTELLPLTDYPKLLQTFRLYGKWLERLGIGSVGVLNDQILAGKSREIILTSEALHEQHVAEIASQITTRREQIRVILIAGPSSSGKTTFSKRLSIQLLRRAFHTDRMDNFFVVMNTRLGMKENLIMKPWRQWTFTS